MEKTELYAHQEYEAGEWLPEFIEEGLSKEFAQAIVDESPLYEVQVTFEFDGTLRPTEAVIAGKRFVPAE